MSLKILVRAVTAAAAIGLGVSSASATVITFDDGAIAVGAALSNQYAAQGVTFAPGGGSTTGVINPTTTTQGFVNATLPISTVTTESSSGVAAPLSGNVLRSSSAWLSETGDAVFTMTFSTPITTLSMDFGAVGSLGQPSIFAVDPNTGVAYTAGLAPATLNGTVTAALTGPTTTVIVVPGNYNDYVAIDNINFTSAPEPTCLAGLGLAGLAAIRRRRA